MSSPHFDPQEPGREPTAFEEWKDRVTKGGTVCIGLTENDALKRAFAAGAEDMRNRAAALCTEMKRRVDCLLEDPELALPYMAKAGHRLWEGIHALSLSLSPPLRPTPGKEASDA